MRSYRLRATVDPGDQKTPDLVPQQKRGHEIRRLFVYVEKRRRLHFVFVIALMVLGALAEASTVGALIPFLSLVSDPSGSIGQRVSHAVGSAFGAEADVVLVTGAAFMILIVASGAIRLALAYHTGKFVYLVGHELGRSLFSKSINQEYNFYLNFNSSEAVAGLNRIQFVTGQIILPIMHSLSAIFIGIGIIVMLAVVDFSLTISTALAFVAMYASIVLAARSKLSEYGRTITREEQFRIKVVQEALGGIRDIILNSTSKYFTAAFTKVDKRFRMAQSRSVFIGAAPRYVIESGGMILVAGIAIFLNSTGGDSLLERLPALGALALGAQRLLPLMQQVYVGWMSAISGKASLEDVLRILELPEQSPTLTVGPPPKFQEEIRFEHVSFSYDLQRGKAALRNVSLVIPKGARVGVHGRTGSGKSTFGDLLMGLLLPSSGSILVDGKPLDAVTARQWRALVAHVPQQIFLADTTFERNIAFGVDDESIDRSLVQEAAKRAQLHEYINTLPDRYDTVVGEQGVKLSGGQRQRIAIARALYSRAELIVFDEATSALDNVTEAMVMDQLFNFGRDITIVIIAHRISTLSRTDIQFKVEDGDVIRNVATVVVHEL